MTNRVQGPPLVHSRLINTLSLGLFSSKELSYGCRSALDQCYEQCRQTAAKQTGPCLEKPATTPAPPGSDRSPNGGLRWGPRGPLYYKTGPQGVSLLLFSISHTVIPLSLDCFSIRAAVSTSASLIRSADLFSCVCLRVITTAILMWSVCVCVSTADCKSPA